MNRRHALTAIGLSSLTGTLLASCDRGDNQWAADNVEAEPLADDGRVDLLFVQTSEGVRFEGDQLILKRCSSPIVRTIL